MTTHANAGPFTPRQRARGQLYAVLANSGSGIFMNVCFGAIMMLYASRALGLDPAEVGGIIGLTWFGTLLQFVFIPVCKRVGKARLAAFGFAVRGVLAVALLFVTPEAMGSKATMAVVLAVLLVTLRGIMLGVSGATWQPLLRDITTTEDRGRFFSRMRGVFSVVNLVFLGVVSCVAGEDITPDQFRVMVIVVAIINLFGAYACLRIPSVDTPERFPEISLSNYLAVIRTSRIFRLPFCIRVLLFVSLFTVFPVYMKKVLQTPDNVSSFCFLVQMLVTVLSFMVWGRVCDIVGYKSALRGIIGLLFVFGPLTLFMTPFGPDFAARLRASLPSFAALAPWEDVAITSAEGLTLGALLLYFAFFGALHSGVGIAVTSVEHDSVDSEDAVAAMPVYYMAVIMCVGVITSGQGLVVQWAADMEPVPVGWMRIDAVNIFFFAGWIGLAAAFLLARRLPNVRSFGARDFYSALFSNPLRSILSGFEQFHPQEERRSGMARRMGGTRNPLSISILAEMLDDPSYEVDIEAVRQLGASPHPEAARPLRDLLADPEYAYLRDHVIRALGELEDEESVDMLLDILAEPKAGSRVHAAALRALGRIGDARAVEGVETFVRAMDDDTIPLVVASACYALLRLDAEGETAAVCRLLPRLEKSHARYEVVYLVGELVGIDTGWILRAASKESLALVFREEMEGRPALATDETGRAVADALETKDHAAFAALVAAADRTGISAAEAGLLEAFDEQTGWSGLDVLAAAWLVRPDGGAP